MHLYHVLQRIAANPSTGVVLNPVVGPESIAGSSRMKGGSVTLILLDAICSSGVLLQNQLCKGEGTAEPVDLLTIATAMRESWLVHASTVSRLYAHVTPEIASLVASGAGALCTSVAQSASVGSGRFVSPTGTGRILYVGDGAGG